MAGRRSASWTSLRLDLAGLPRTWRVPASRWQPWVWGAYAALALAHVVLLLVGDRPLDRVEAGVAVLQVALGVGAVLLWTTTAVRLEPDGYRVGGAVWRGRLRPWSGVVEVRAPSRWTKHAEIRGTRASDAPVALPGMTAEQAVELQRRLVGARERAARERAT